MDPQDLFTAGSDGLIPEGDKARQAVDSLRGYAYQVIAAALAWLDLDDKGRLFLEVAEDYAIMAAGAFVAVQVKDTGASEAVTLNTASVRDSISHFVSLTAAHPRSDVHLRYFTTSEIGMEKAISDRPGGIAGLHYWRRAATSDDIGPIRAILESDKFSMAVQEFVRSRDDAAMRRDLLRKVHWDCGTPDAAGLRSEFAERLVVIGRDAFQLPAPETARLVDILICRVLEKSIAKQPAERVLTRADFYRIMDHSTRMSLPRADFDVMARLAAGLTSSALRASGAALAIALAGPSWIVEGDTLPAPRRMVPREALQRDIIDRLKRYGASCVVGASGLGKSSMARAVARQLASGFVLIDFRGIDAEETRTRLDALVPRIGGLRGTLVIFEDFNHFSDASVASSLARTFEALRRRDLVSIVTCYQSPTARALAEAGFDAGCVIACPYLSEEEVGELVELYGGDPETWRRIAHVSGAFGHPQLVHAFVAGMSARGWPRNEIAEIAVRGFSSGDIDAEREGARRTLVSHLPENSRNLLYRLSLTVGRFDRPMALAIASVPISIAQAGECLDALVGPWLEAVGREAYRVSPLASRSGQATMTAAEQADIHSAIAAQYMASRTINGAEVDVILLHALLGKNRAALFRLAKGVLLADQQTVERLAQSFASFKLYRTDKPIYREDLPVAAMLRLAQFKVLVAAQETDKIAPCARALFDENAALPNDEMQYAFKAMTYIVVLVTMGIANYLDNWLQLLAQFHDILEGDAFVSGLRTDIEAKDGSGVSVFGMLFSIGVAGIRSVARFEFVIDRLSEIDGDRRSTYLAAIAKFLPDYSVLVNGPWSSEHQQNTLNGADAAARYQRIAAKVAPWGVEAITAQCWIARAVMLDEYNADKDGALAVLDEGVAVLGENILLSRARAKIYWRAQEHERALPILREIADEVGRDNPIERCFGLREAAICAAKCGEWAQAKAWFLDGKEAASRSELPDMMVMGVGLGADAAVAALHTGSIQDAFIGLAAALTALSEIDPESSLRAMYCHHVVRHTVLWTKSRIDKSKIDIDGETLAIEPGCCSNPEPSSAVTERPLGPLDLVWYMLAECEVSSGTTAGIADSLYGRLAAGAIPVMEIDLRMRRVSRAMTDLNAVGFAGHLWGHVEAIAYMSQQAQRIRESFNVMAPERGDIDPVSRSDLRSPSISAVACDAICAYAIVAACRNASEAIRDLESALEAEFGDDIPGREFLVRANSPQRPPQAKSFEEALIDAVRYFRSGEHAPPRTHCMASVYFFRQAGRSGFKNNLIPVIAAWQRDAWTRIIAAETFRLVRPLQTVPAIRTALAIAGDDERFLGSLFLATARATGVELLPDMRKAFEALAVRPAAA